MNTRGTPRPGRRRQRSRRVFLGLRPVTHCRSVAHLASLYAASHGRPPLRVPTLRVRDSLLATVGFDEDVEHLADRAFLGDGFSEW